jgi:peptide/nickel transport system ATP-binding protein
MTGPGAAAPVLAVDDLSVSLPTPEGTVSAVRGLSYSVSRGEVLAVVGESGSGKTMSCLAIMGLLPPGAVVAGSARFGGQELVGASESVLRRVRGDRIAMIFQDPLTSLNPVYSVGRQIAETVRAHRPSVSRRDARRQAVEMLDLVRIPQAAVRVGQYPHELSGGMRQRVVIAMALVNRPDVLFADEPTTALDVTVQAQILDTLLELRSELGLAVVLVTHDLGVVAGTADRVLVMYAGRAVESGPVRPLFRRPRMPYTAGLLAALPAALPAVPVLPAGGPAVPAAGGPAVLPAGGPAPDRRLSPIPGTPPSLLSLPSGCAFAPRCPLATDVCTRVDPPLAAVPGDPDHAAACHHTAALADLADPRSLFRTAVP